MSPKAPPVLTLIDDDARIRTWLESALPARGFEVASAANGLAGLKVVVDRSPDLVLLDLGLPDIDGLEVLKMIRAVSDAPLSFTTARDDERDMSGALQAGCRRLPGEAILRRSSGSSTACCAAPPAPRPQGGRHRGRLARRGGRP